MPNRVETGTMFELRAIKILKQLGYNSIRLTKSHSHSDIICEKEGIVYNIEVKGRLNGRDLKYFMIKKSQLKELGKLKNVLYMFINDKGYTIVPYEKLKDRKRNYSIKIENIIVNVQGYLKRNITITLAQDRWLDKNSIDLSKFVQNKIDLEMANQEIIKNSTQLEKANI